MTKIGKTSLKCFSLEKQCCHLSQAALQILSIFPRTLKFREILPIDRGQLEGHLSLWALPLWRVVSFNSVSQADCTQPSE